jgi:hypothetical protein
LKNNSNYNKNYDFAYNNFILGSKSINFYYQFDSRKQLNIILEKNKLLTYFKDKNSFYIDLGKRLPKFYITYGQYIITSKFISEHNATSCSSIRQEICAVLICVMNLILKKIDKYKNNSLLIDMIKYLNNEKNQLSSTFKRSLYDIINGVYDSFNLFIPSCFDIDGKLYDISKLQSIVKSMQIDDIKSLIYNYTFEYKHNFKYKINYQTLNDDRGFYDDKPMPLGIELAAVRSELELEEEGDHSITDSKLNLDDGKQSRSEHNPRDKQALTQAIANDSQIISIDNAIDYLDESLKSKGAFKALVEHDRRFNSPSYELMMQNIIDFSNNLLVNINPKIADPIKTATYRITMLEHKIKYLQTQYDVDKVDKQLIRCSEKEKELQLKISDLDNQVYEMEKKYFEACEQRTLAVMCLYDLMNNRVLHDDFDRLLKEYKILKHATLQTDIDYNGDEVLKNVKKLLSEHKGIKLDEIQNLRNQVQILKDKYKENLEQISIKNDLIDELNSKNNLLIELNRKLIITRDEMKSKIIELMSNIRELQADQQQCSPVSTSKSGSSELAHGKSIEKREDIKPKTKISFPNSKDIDRKSLTERQCLSFINHLKTPAKSLDSKTSAQPKAYERENIVLFDDIITKVTKKDNNWDNMCEILRMCTKIDFVMVLKSLQILITSDDIKRLRVIKDKFNLNIETIVYLILLQTKTVLDYGNPQ